MAEQHTSIKLIMDKLLRHPLLSDLTLETVVDYTVDFMRIVGVPRMFIDKIEAIPIINYKGLVPTDWVDTIQIKFNEKPIQYASDLFHLQQPKTLYTATRVGNSFTDDALETLTAYLEEHSMDNIIDNDGVPIIKIEISQSESEDNITVLNRNVNPSGNYTFQIQGSYIHTSLESGIVYMAYRAIATDSEGFPLLPDNSAFTRALEAYIKEKHFNILYDLGKISGPVYNNAQTQYAWAVGACENEFKRLDLSKAESFFNSYRTLIIRDHAFEQSFRHNNRKENYRG